MGQPNILLTRIDNRLVHGQVLTWTKTLGINLIVVANDQVVEDPLQQKLMRSTADSAGIDIRFFTLEKTITIIHNASPRQKIFLVIKTPHEARILFDGNVPITELNVGNMHYTHGKKEISKKVYVDDRDMDDLNYLSSKGINIYIQDIPGDKKIPWKKVVKN